MTVASDTRVTAVTVIVNGIVVFRSTAVAVGSIAVVQWQERSAFVVV